MTPVSVKEAKSPLVLLNAAPVRVDTAESSLKAGIPIFMQNRWDICENMFTGMLFVFYLYILIILYTILSLIITPT